jgi:hypothetical protein
MDIKLEPRWQTESNGPPSSSSRTRASARRRVSCPPHTPHITPCTLHPTPCILHHTPYTLHPASYTIHPTPYTLHPTPKTPITCVGGVGSLSPRRRGDGMLPAQSPSPHDETALARPTLHATTRGSPAPRLPAPGGVPGTLCLSVLGGNRDSLSLLTLEAS